jgi:hypothetical protein
MAQEGDFFNLCRLYSKFFGYIWYALEDTLEAYFGALDLLILVIEVGLDHILSVLYYPAITVGCWWW